MTEVTKEQFEAFVRVQTSGDYNMLDPRAQATTGLTRAIYLAVMEQYGKLMEQYPDVK